MPAFRSFLGCHPPQPREAKQGLRGPSWSCVISTQPSPTAKLLPCYQVATLEKTCPWFPNGWMVAARSRTHPTCRAATHTAARSIPVRKAWVSQGTQSLLLAQHPLTRLRDVPATSLSGQPAPPPAPGLGWIVHFQHHFPQWPAPSRSPVSSSFPSGMRTYSIFHRAAALPKTNPSWG